jgi:CBS-domain-containing membrane protein
MSQLTVEDVMTREVVAAGTDTPLKELARLMYRNRISGVPVLDDEERLVGIVTEAALLTAEGRQAEKRPRGAFLRWILEPGHFSEIERQGRQVRAADIMTTIVATVAPKTPLDEAVRVLLDSGVKRLPVVEDHRVAGIVSRHDLLTRFLRSDEDIHHEIVEDVVLRAMWIDPGGVAADVRRGAVRLAGEVYLRSEKEILAEMVRRVDGVVAVDDGDLTFRRDDRDIEPPPPREPPRLERPFP